MALGGVQFFLGREKDDDNDSDPEKDGPDLKQLRHGQQVGKKSKSRDRQIAAAKALLKKVISLLFKGLIPVERTKITISTCEFEFLSYSIITRSSGICRNIVLKASTEGILSPDHQSENRRSESCRPTNCFS